jgi:hypothetical protein
VVVEGGSAELGKEFVKVSFESGGSGL